MAKRANPYIEDFIPQSKVHVSLKQFNNNDDRLKHVYEKTLALLFKGAKKVSTPDALNNNNINLVKKNEKMKQLRIGKDGTLLHSGYVIEHHTTDTTTKQCSCSAPVESQCAYCETVLCTTCQHNCNSCEGTYCAHCMLVEFEGSEVCVSCYG